MTRIPTVRPLPPDFFTTTVRRGASVLGAPVSSREKSNDSGPPGGAATGICGTGRAAEQQESQERRQQRRDLHRGDADLGPALGAFAKLPGGRVGNLDAGSAVRAVEEDGHGATHIDDRVDRTEDRSYSEFPKLRVRDAVRVTPDLAAILPAILQRRTAMQNALLNPLPIVVRMAPGSKPPVPGILHRNAGARFCRSGWGSEMISNSSSNRIVEDPLRKRAGGLGFATCLSRA